MALLMLIFLLAAVICFVVETIKSWFSLTALGLACLSIFFLLGYLQTVNI
jgi:hypothetical protein